ncbi:HpcH/HpaI aldolase/citrate lyase family protein [Amycolatopsis sacchari]|uniref:HpcH/HpaI aldolase/citrate lyase family protein n=1 Tax=Amycolatopsis sacchari TaxID=115433 RepID=UPI003EB97A88
MISQDRLRVARSLLFVPGHRADRFAKAAGSGADAVVLDLEDAVGADRKDEARRNVRDWLADGQDAVVRCNGVESPWFDGDMAMLELFDCAVMVPKVNGPDDVHAVGERLTARSRVMPLLETARGILAAREICKSPTAIRAVFGNADLALELGVDGADRAALTAARQAVVLASAAAGLPAPVDGVTLAVTDDDVLSADCAHGVVLGFGGKLCLHPRQVEGVNAAFSPTSEQLQWAKEVLAAADEHRGSISLVNGRVVGTPIIDQARRVLARAEAIQN